MIFDLACLYMCLSAYYNTRTGSGIVSAVQFLH